MSLSTRRSPNTFATIFIRRRSSPNSRSSSFRVRITRRWAIGKRRCAMQASKSSRKHFTADGNRASYSDTTTSRKHPRHFAGRRLVSGLRLLPKLRPLAIGHLRLQIAHAVSQAAPALRARKTFLDRPDQARSAVGHHEQRVGEASSFHVLKERATALRVLLPPGREMQEPLLTLDGDSSRAQHRLAPLATVQALRDAVRKRVRDLVLRQIAIRERLVFLPQPLGHLAPGRAREQRSALVVAQSRFDVARKKTARIHLDRQV